MRSEDSLSSDLSISLSENGGRIDPPSQTIILGVGNILLSDEGVGVHVIKELTKLNLPQNVRVVDGATEGFGLIDIIKDAERLIVIDAVKGGAPPGSIYRFYFDEVNGYPFGHKTSMHQVGIMEVLSLCEILGRRPRTLIIGIEPKSLDVGMELSQEVREKIPRVIELILEELGCTHEDLEKIGLL